MIHYFLILVPYEVINLFKLHLFSQFAILKILFNINTFYFRYVFGALCSF